MATFLHEAGHMARVIAMDEKKLADMEHDRKGCTA